MDQKTISSGGILTGVLVIFCGILVAPVAIGMVASYPSEIWWLGLVMMGSIGLMIYGGIQSIRKAKKLDWQASQEQGRIQEEVALLTGIQEKPTTKNVTVANSPIQVGMTPQTQHDVLAHWTFTANEWKKFMTLERKRRKSSTKYESLAILILGTILLMYSRNAAFWTAFGLSLFIAVIIAILRYAFTMNAFGEVLPSNTVTITDQSIMINNKLNPYRSENFWVEKIQILDGNPDVLEITYAWNTRKGRTFDEMRVPIPTGKKEQAQFLIQKILKPSL